MSATRIDRHITWVQSKLATQRFLDAFAIAIAAFCAAVLLTVILTRSIQLHPPRPLDLAIATAAIAVAAAIAWAILRRPTPMQAAIAIDRQLGLKEKFSTALEFRTTSDPFALAAIRDAETTADNITLSKQFPFHFPKAGAIAIAIALLLGAAFLWYPQLDLLGRAAHAKQIAYQQAQHDQARTIVKQALVTVNSYPKAVASNAAIELAKRDLENLLNQPSLDPDAARRNAFKALQQSGDAVKDEIRKSDQFARAQDQQRQLLSLNISPNEQGPVADAQRDIAKGNFASAIQKLNQVATKFNQMPQKDQAKAAQQMANLAKQLQQMAQNPAQQQQLQQQLQQMGASKQQAQQLAKTMQQAAAGNPQAQQQLQQLKQQLQQQMAKNGTPQQQQAMQQMMKQMQAQAQSQQSAQQMAQSAQQMAQAMQQQSSSQGQQQQQSSSQQQGSQQGQQQGSQQGSQSGNQPGSQMAQAQQQMQQALGQMDAVQKDAEEMSAAQDSTSKAESDAAGDNNNGNGGNDKSQGNNKDHSGSDATGQWAAGNPAGQKGNGMGKAGQGNGGNGQKTQAPYTVKKEVDPTQNIDNGKILASMYVKAGTIKGESKVGLSQAAAAAQNDEADEVDEEAVSKESQKVVKQYFQTMQEGQ